MKHVETAEHSQDIRENMKIVINQSKAVFFCRTAKYRIGLEFVGNKVYTANMALMAFFNAHYK